MGGGGATWCKRADDVHRGATGCGGQMMCRGVQQGVECRCNRVQKGEWRRNNETGVKISRVNRVQKGVTGCKR